MLQIQASELLPVKQQDLTLIVADKAEDAQLMQPRQRARHGFEGQAEIVSNIATAHRQRQDAGRRQPPVHLDQEGSDTLQRSLAAEQKHVIFRVLQVVRGHAEQIASDHGIALRHQFEAAPLY